MSQPSSTPPAFASPRVGRTGIVRISGRRVGLIREVGDGSEFTYDPQWIERGGVPISLTLPVRTKPYVSRTVHPFFENLLPEGWLLEIATAKLKISKDDVFGLLLATCSDCIGAVEVVPETESEREP